MSEQVVLTTEQRARATAIAKRLSEIKSAKERRACEDCAGCRRAAQWNEQYGHWKATTLAAWKAAEPGVSAWRPSTQYEYWLMRRPAEPTPPPVGSLDCEAVGWRKEREGAALDLEVEWLHERAERLQVRIL